MIALNEPSDYDWYKQQHFEEEWLAGISLRHGWAAIRSSASEMLPLKHNIKITHFVLWP